MVQACDFSEPDIVAPHLKVENLLSKHGETLIQHDLNFSVRHGDIFIIMGPSGSGKSTLLRHLVGLDRPAGGSVKFDGTCIWGCGEAERETIMKRIGVTYQTGGLWSSMTLLENVSVPLHRYTDLSDHEIAELATLKLAMVGLAGFDDHYPSEISGGMQKRAGLARAIALDPDLLFFDEPSAGLDPVTSRRLDDLILALRDNLGATVVIVTHELPSIFAIGNNSVFLDPVAKTQIALGHPKKLLKDCDNPIVHSFLTRGSAPQPAGGPIG
jgi:phospholipid/cholesterol/gamma-HCH transport system ATP-binding protein